MLSKHIVVSNFEMFKKIVKNARKIKKKLNRFVNLNS